ncbi:acyl-CoA dehydrogenase family protein [Parasphingorhabdus halotolerans]|uniref:Pimeloyl-CoA dehydrogenase small subunit n=1 Tax=Parasphingorhabdus halotolerans TaxID=2725558 RepID=A0A6H2DNG1_9SPHN|nr:acyl-CoA dehydrogenase [Parasphingorhabdus halotolerans]QJB69495.1 pimeloyl-CoA dehydrogenase small subunit [Parasphingorhabdus halotolerans]
MDFDFTDEQNMVRDGISRLIREEYDWDTRRSVIESDAGWRPELWAQLAELGMLAAPFSEEDGGFGGATEAMIIMEEFGKGLAVEPFVPSVICAGGFLKHGGSAEQKEEYIGGIISGEMIFAFAYAEPRGRYDLADLQTTARKDGSDYVINGHKAVVIGAPWATHFVVTARTSGDQRDAAGVSVFVVARDADGVSQRDYGTVDGRRASEVYFENVKVSSDALIGEADNGLPLIEKVVDEATAAVCAEAAGVMQVTNAMTLDYSRQRKQFGTPIGSFQVLQHRMADMLMEHEQSVSMMYLATIKLDEDEATRKKNVSAAKVRIGQAARFVGQSAIQTHGGMGMTDELAVGSYFKRLSIIEGEFGSVDHHMRRHIKLSAA